ncbi:hypothetical protein [Halothermothrix orenii]|uniref:Uncharacterized protein n=1 Tax=Halothermothrix orenii (strain H 168 / OCM 544 / DSM 9562) TaxID=373903 RepID=B8D2A7_HALOH|nr:hypothetical protein [Halothermothrix orenii]ACL69334.1 hypothetical protein Hore_05770 [Halothermothrix orenii H 168]
MKTTTWLIFPIIFFFLFVTCSLVSATSPDVVWIIVDRITVNNIIASKTPHFNGLQNIGAFGLINVRTAGQIRAESTYLTAGAGKRSKGSKDAQKGINKGKGVINYRYDSLVKLNKDNPYHPTVGLLGEVLKDNGIKVGVLGNTDTIDQKNRSIVSFAMDQKGEVPLGDVSKGLLKKVEKPWGYESDFEVFRKKFGEFKNKVDLLIIQTGDTTRIDNYVRFIGKAEINREKIKAIEKIDNFIGFVLQVINLEETQLGILMLNPPVTDLENGNKLGWILLAGPEFEKGWVTSLSTRRKGIVTISDLLPTLLNRFKVSYPEVTGSKISYIRQQKASWHQLYNLREKIKRVSNLRPVFVKGFILLQLIMICLAIILLIKKDLPGSVIIHKGVEYLLVSLFLVPLNFLILSQIIFPHFIHNLVILIAFTIVEFWVLMKINESRLFHIIVICLGLWIVIIVDLLNNSRLMADSLLGFSSVIGARYYGLGNEYMGLFIGSMLVGFTGVLDYLSKKGVNINKKIIFLSPVLFLSFWFIASPALGANFGGAITALVAITVTMVYLKYGFNFKKIILFTPIVGFVILFVMYLDYTEILGPRTHIGKAFAYLLKGRTGGIIGIIKRKLAMNIKLLKWTIWTRVLLGFILYLIVLFLYPIGRFKKLLKKQPNMAAGFYGGLAGTLVTMMVNDSGVVAAATLLFYPIMTLLYFISKPGYK